MPLVELGLVSRLDDDDPALAGQPPVASSRSVRCVAGFYDDVDNAESVAQALIDRVGLHEDQVEVIDPQGLTRADYDRVAQRWQSQRSGAGWRRRVQPLALGALAGMVSGGLAALLGLGLFGGKESLADPLSWLMPGVWAGALAGAATAAVLTTRPPRHRFDETVARKLRHGQAVVVAHGLAPLQQAPALACLQETSRSWCAEAPRRELLL